MNLYRLKGKIHGASYGLGSGRNTIGRSSENLVRIPDSSVSGVHCEIEIGETGVFVRDLQSTNGTFIDGQPVAESAIRPGQVLQLGTVALVLEEESVTIAVPTLPSTAVEETGPKTLADGTLACSRFPELQAAFRCTKCQRPFHGSALRQVRLSSGRLPLLFCPECDGKCEIIPGFSRSGDSGSILLNPRKLLSRITQTIRLGWRKPE
jgi:pSer/pThr/pTyr-binding forkhead associated (FHA) protein